MDGSQQDLRSLYHELTELKKREQRRSRNARRLGYLVAAGLTTGVVCAVAQAGEQLITFNAREPAVAADVNHNFSLLKRWLEQKVGEAGSERLTLRCESCGDKGEDWGTLTVQGRVLSVSGGNLHLSPPGDSDVVINQDYRAAGGNQGGDGAGLQVQGDTLLSSKLQVKGDTTLEGSLTLANGHHLPIKLTDQVSDETESGATKLKDLVPTGNSMCFLVQTWVEEADQGSEHAGCAIFESQGMWQLQTYSQSSDAGAHCAARCLQW